MGAFRSASGYHLLKGVSSISFLLIHAVLKKSDRKALGYNRKGGHQNAKDSQVSFHLT